MPQNGQIPMGYMGMSPAAVQAGSWTPAPMRPSPGAARVGEQAAVAQRMGIGAVPPHKKGGRVK